METTMESSGDAAILSEENGYSKPAVNHSDGDVKQHSMVNGLSNGYDKEKKDKERHKDRDKHDKDKYREKDKHRDSDRDKHRSKDGDKEKHRDKDKHKDSKDRDRDKEKHRDKDKERDKEKDRERNKEKDRERDKDRDKSKHSSSSSSKDKHSSSSSKDKDKERKDRDREKEKSKTHDDKERKDKDHKSSSSSSKDKEHKSSSSSKHSSSSSSKPSSESSSKDKENKDKVKDREKDKERDKNRDKEKDKERSKDKHSSSSSSNKDKDRHSSDKHKSDKEKEKEKHSSSSSKDKERHSSEKKDKHRDKDREKEKSKDKERSKEKEKEKEKSEALDSSFETSIKSQPPEIKEELNDFSFQPSIKEESMDLDDDDGKLMIKEEPTDDESKMESSFDMSGIKNESSIKMEEEEEEDDDDMPMAARMEKMKREIESDDEDDVPLIARKKPKKAGSAKKRKKEDSDYDDEEDFKPAKKKKQQQPVKKEKKPVKVKQESSITESPKKRKKKEEEEHEVWKWWEEEKKPDGVKWNFLEHKGPIFAPPYEPLPPNVKFYYDDKEMKLSESAEEVATFYARMLDHDYTTKEAFNKNFMHDWRKVMTEKERDTITSLRKCNFKHMLAYFTKLSEERKAMSKEEKKAIKEKNEELQKEFGFCTIDGHKEKIGNFKIEPPGLFRGRGEHPKMGKLKQRVVAEDIIINCSKDSKIPQPPPGHRWKEVRHDNTVTWLASWTESVQGQVKYIMLNPSSKLKGEKDWQKYETARKLAKSIDKIREDYVADWKSKEMKIRQRAVAMYFIDKLALRAGNEKDEDQADTVGCCSLRVEHIQLLEEKDGKENVVVFDFLGKDSIRYYNEVPVERRVFKNLMLFMENKKKQDDLFDRLNTAVLNKHLSDLMEGLTAKVFRTYNASWTLQAQLKELTDPDSTVAEKLLAYNRANRAVAILCNHQRAVPKTHDKSMANLREKLANKRAAVEDAEKNLKHAKRDAKNGSAKERILADKAKKTLDRLKEQLLKLELQETDKEENKCIALGTSKLNYLDPRISVAWCKKFDVPIEKIFNKTQRDKFRWAIDMASADYVF